MSSKKESKGKKLQVGTPRLDYDYEVSCQTGHVVMESECQADDDDTMDIVPAITKSEEQSVQLFSRKKEFCDMESQSECISDENYILTKVTKSKKVQVGHPRLLSNLDVECQSGHLLDEASIETGVDEVMRMERRHLKEEATLLFDDLIDDSIQYDSGILMMLSSKKESSVKNVQVGTSGLNYFYEVSIQTDDNLIDSENGSFMIMSDGVPRSGYLYEASGEVIMRKDHFEKDTSSDLNFSELKVIEISKSCKGVQCGNSYWTSFVNMSIQSISDWNVGASEVEDDGFVIVNENKYDSNSSHLGKVINKECGPKSTEIQVGSSCIKMFGERSCQTMPDEGLLIVDRDPDDFEVIPNVLVFDVGLLKDISLNEDIQNSQLKKSQESKNFQIGQSGLQVTVSVECQTVSRFAESVGKSENLSDFINLERNNVEFEPFIIREFEKDISHDYPDKSLKSNENKGKGKKLQVGISRLDADCEVCTQTNIFVSDVAIETDEYNDNKDFHKVKFQPNESYQKYKSLPVESFEKEVVGVVCDTEDSFKECFRKSKKIQVGYPRIEFSVDVECQSKNVMHNACIGTDAEGFEIIEMNEILYKSSFDFENLIDEVIQYESGSRLSGLSNTGSKGKKLQVGSPRLYLDYEASCQTNILTKESVNQTDIGYRETEESIEKSKIENQDYSALDIHKVFNDQEIQYESPREENMNFGILKKSKKIQVGHSRVNVDIDNESEAVIVTLDSNVGTEWNRLSLMEATHQEDSRNLRFNKMQNEEIQYLRNNYKTQYIHMGTSTWDYETTKYNLLTFDLEFGNESMHEKLLSKDPITLEAIERSIQRGNYVQFSESKLSKRLSSTSDQSTQTSDFGNSHSVSLEISTKMPKFSNEAHLILNYFNKQVDIKEQTSEVLNKYEKDSQQNNIFNCSKDSKNSLIDRYVQYSKTSVSHDYKLTEVNIFNSNDYLDDRKKTKFDDTISVVPRTFSTNGSSKSKPLNNTSTIDIVTIPGSNTKDFINLFESISVQVNIDEEREKDFESEFVPIHQIQESKYQPSCSETNLQSKNFENRTDYPETKKMFNYELSLSETAEINIAPKIVKSKETKIFKSILTQSSCSEIINGNAKHQSCQTSLSHDSSQALESFLLSNVIVENPNTNPMEISLVPKFIESDEIMHTHHEKYREASAEFGKDEVKPIDHKMDVKLHQKAPEYIEISLAPKLVDKIANIDVKSNKFVRDNSGMSREKYSIPYSVQCDHKMTSTLKIIEKSNIGTQIYSRPLYDGHTQTTISTRNYGVQVVDLQSMYSSPISPMSSFSIDNELMKSNAQTNLSSLKSPFHSSLGLECNFEEDYVVEYVKSRSVVTTKQEVLPKLSYDFVDNKEEQAKLDVNNRFTTKPKLVSTKTQSWNDNDFCEATSQTNFDNIFSDDEIYEIYKKMINSRQVKEQGVQECNDDNLFEILVEKKGLPYIINKYRSVSCHCEKSNQTSSIQMNSVKTQYEPEPAEVDQIQAVHLGTERESAISHTTNNRPSHKNKRIQRGCGYFNMKDAETETDQSFGDHIEVTYTETILEESVITKRPLSKVDEHYDYSKSSSLSRRSTCSTPIPVSNLQNKYVQSVIYPSQIFLQEENYDEFITIIKSLQITAVYDHRSKKYSSLKEAIKNGVLKLNDDKYFISKSKSLSIENAVKEGHLIVKYEA